MVQLLWVMNFLLQTCKSEELSKTELWADFETISVQIHKVFGRDFYRCNIFLHRLFDGIRILLFQYSYLAYQFSTRDGWSWRAVLDRIMSWIWIDICNNTQSLWPRDLQILLVLWVLIPMKQESHDFCTPNPTYGFSMIDTQSCETDILDLESTSEINFDQFRGCLGLKSWYIPESWISFLFDQAGCRSIVHTSGNR